MMRRTTICRRKKDRLYAFHQEILEGYIRIMSGDRNVLFRMKELWFYLGDCFTNADKYLKKIKKIGSAGCVSGKL